MTALASIEAAAPSASGAPGVPGLEAERPTPMLGLLMTVVAVLIPFLAYFGNLGFAPLVGVAGVLCLPLLAKRRPPVLGVAVLLALLVWALVSMSWSIAAPRLPDFRRYKQVEALTGLKLVLELALYGAFGVASTRLSQKTAARSSLILAVVLVALSVVFLVEAGLGTQLYQWIRTKAGQTARPDLAIRDVSRVAFILTLFYWPAALRLRQANLTPAAVVLVGGTAVGALLLGVDAPLAALAISTLVFVTVRATGRLALWVLIAGVVLYFSTAPLIAHAFPVLHLPQTPPPGADESRLSWAIRLDIWRFAAQRIMERPLIGWGLDASRMFSPHIPLHTHDAALQVWLELGGVGAALAALFWVWIVTRIERIEAVDPNMAAAAAASASAYLTLGALSFGVWQEWWLALGTLTLAACAIGAAGRRGHVLASGHDELIPLA